MSEDLREEIIKILEKYHGWSENVYSIDADSILRLISAAVQKIENPFPMIRVCANEEGALTEYIDHDWQTVEDFRQAVLNLLK